MTFEQALAAMRKGNKLRRKCWKYKDEYIFFSGDIIVKSNKTGISMFPEEQIVGDDWEIYRAIHD